MTWNAEEFVNRAVDDGKRTDRTSVTSGNEHVVILMALHDGAAHVEAQMASFSAQTHDDWSLLVSDDDSRDDGPERVRRFSRHSGHPVALVRGPGAGFARNFLHLLQAAGPIVRFAALSDQDDVWLPGKLERALSRLSALPDDRPALYAGRTTICDAALRPLRRSPLFELPPSFGNALVQSIGGGNTMVLNRAALDLAQETARRAAGIVAHDWWLYQLVSGAGGRVIYDPEPMVLYRQHSANLIGANDTALASAVRLAQLIKGRYRDWNTTNVRILRACNHWLTPDARETLERFSRARGGTALSRVRAVGDAGVYRQTHRGNAALRFAAILNRM